MIGKATNMRLRSLRSLCLTISICSFLTLSACGSSRREADTHVEAARVHLAQDEQVEAVEDLRAALNVYPSHQEARALIAETLLKLGRHQSALRHYLVQLRLHPDDTDALLVLGNYAVAYGNWEIAQSYLDQLTEVAPDEPSTEAIRTAIDFRNAIANRDAEARRLSATRARQLKLEMPDNPTLRLIIIDSLILDGNDRAALDEIEAAQSVMPANPVLYQRKLRILGWLGDMEGTESLLLEMVEVFPENPVLPRTLIRLYVGTGRLDEAEAFLRERAAAPEAKTRDRNALVEFLATHRSKEAAIAQCDIFIEAGTETANFRTLRASFLFDLGQTDIAISEMEALLEELEEGWQENQAKVALARMLLAQGNTVGARSLIEEVLEANPTMVGALALRANRLIDLDRAEEALEDLDRAVQKEPANPLVLTLRANAFIRLGETNRALAEFEAAVNASGNAPEESLRYASLLETTGQIQEARRVIYDAIRLAPNDLSLLAEAGRVNLQLKDWSATEDIEGHLRDLATEPATGLADRLRARMLYLQDRQDDALAFLEELAGQSDENLGVRVAILRTHLSRGDVEEARAYADQMLERAPNDARVRFVSAAVHAETGDVAAARQAYQALIADDAGGARAMVELARLEISEGNLEAAGEILRDGLESYPDDAPLQWLWAGLLQKEGRHDEAIAVLEALYDQDSATDSVANNLASLLSTLRSDPESLEKAYRIARRLRDSSVPEYADTYGWIAYLRGEYDDALRHLERAAEALPDEPTVQIHLAMTYLALDRSDDAAATFLHALEVSGDSASEAAEIARKQIEQLQ